MKTVKAVEYSLNREFYPGNLSQVATVLANGSLLLESATLQPDYASDFLRWLQRWYGDNQ